MKNGVTYTGIPIPTAMWRVLERLAQKRDKDVSETALDLISEGLAHRAGRRRVRA